MSQVELACKEMVFHFNKKHLEDPEVPMWIIKAKGESYYVNHVDCSVPWSTKETPDNSHTKGAIKIKECLVTIDDDNCAAISVLTVSDKARIRNQERGIVRVITAHSSKLKSALSGMKHGPIKNFNASCGSSHYVVDLLKPDEATMFMLQNSGTDRFFRVLMPNEHYYKAYDDPTLLDELDDDDL